MKSPHKKTFYSSLVALFLGTSCCWISSLVIWVGGTTTVTFFATYLGGIQFFLITIGVFLAMVSFFLFIKK